MMPEELSGGGICSRHKIVLAEMERNEKETSLFFGNCGQVHENKQQM